MCLIGGLIFLREMPPRKSACFASLAPRTQDRVRVYSCAARQPGPLREADTWRRLLRTEAVVQRHIVRTLEAQVAKARFAQTITLTTRLNATLGCIGDIEARDPEPKDGLAKAGSSC
ncbi:hypothetical protein Tco_1132566 [Tanacetum coccineum]|uniref:Uncharacterized protein n=1 Tax=Tanacetum coccineum TaxID=301880 RepID=A0ABQ5JCA4_9ASTR